MCASMESTLLSTIDFYGFINRKEISSMMLRLHFNQTSLPPATFFLMGIPGLEETHLWLAALLSTMCTMVLVGNSLIMTVIWVDPALHEPMYYFLCVLACVDIIMATSVTPKMLSVFWSGNGIIGFTACFTQMYIVHTATVVESGLLLAMAFDRYVAICKPLHYNVILTPWKILGINVATVARATIGLTPLSWMVSHLPYCSSHAVPHSYCEHMAVANLVCADHTLSNLYTLLGSSAVVGMDVTFISASYSLILQAVFNLSSKNARHKALSTCGSHVGVMTLFYLPGLISVYVDSWGEDMLPVHTQVLLADLYLVIPPTLNPLIYGLRPKKICQGVWNTMATSLLCHHCVNSKKERREFVTVDIRPTREI
ncbi:olfactory receptor 52I1-like [Phascolarctos cinereus]|uniref:Olfactory receptor n=1 Tax=Phascolarctos cinereus TaxID=38626 RepID=A0A6P5IQS0_PHACI|nr:olfactory receptor 52I1-like [Phascolarctos cinereus]